MTREGIEETEASREEEGGEGGGRERKISGRATRVYRRKEEGMERFEQCTSGGRGGGRGGGGGRTRRTRKINRKKRRRRRRRRRRGRNFERNKILHPSPRFGHHLLL